MLKVTILGCGGSGGVPLIGGTDEAGNWGDCDPAEPRNRRSRTAALVQAPDGRRLLIDAGPDMRAQLLAAAVGRLDAVFFTHAHADHILGVDDIRQINRLTGKALPAYGTAITLTKVQERFDYAFLPPPQGFFFRPAVTPLPITHGEAIEIAGMRVMPFLQDHGVMDSTGLRIGRFAYSTDLVDIPEESWPLLEGLDTWVVGCFQRVPHKVHAHLDLVLDWVRRIRPRRTVLTHMSTGLDYASLRAELPPGVEPAHDGLVLEIPLS